MLAGRRPTIFGDGEQSRDFVYVADVVQANLKAAMAPDAPGKAFNVASGVCTTVNRLYGLIAEQLDVSEPPVYGEPRAGDILHSGADITAAKTVLGYDPAFSLEAGLAPTVDWLRAQEL